LNSNLTQHNLIPSPAFAVNLRLQLAQGANRVIIFDVDWNPSWEEQAQGKVFFLVGSL
jgi:hypothetical protein